MASLTDNEINNTYKGLIKTTSSCQLPATGKVVLSDGDGNASSLSIGATGEGATICGTAVVTGNITQSDSGCTSTLGVAQICDTLTVAGVTCLNSNVDVVGVVTTNNNNCLAGETNATDIDGTLSVGGSKAACSKITALPKEKTEAGVTVQASNISPIIRFNDVGTNNQYFSVGLDACNSSNFKISTGTTVNNSNNFVITSDGCVNINTTNGTDNLTVGGTGLFTGDLRSNGDISLINGGLSACNGLGTAGFLLESTGSKIEWVAKTGGSLCTGNVCGTGTGTKVPKWSDASTLVDSSISEVGSDVNICNNLIVSDNATVNGYLKVNDILRDGCNSSGSAGQLLKSTGSGIEWFTSDGTSCTGNIAGNGTVNTLTKFTGSTSVGDSVIKESSNNIGIGTNPSASYKLDVNGCVNATGFQGNLTGNICGSTSVGGSMTAAGNVAGATLSISSNASVGLLAASGEVRGASICSLGTIKASGDIVAFNSSDERLKDNLTCITDSNNIINSLTGYSFDWNDKSEREGPGIGVLAQDVQKVLPNAVCERENGYLAVDYIQLIPVMIEELKRLNKIVKKLES
jgi:hypothetical protein